MQFIRVILGGSMLMLLPILLKGQTHTNDSGACSVVQSCANGSINNSIIICEESNACNCTATNCNVVQSCANGVISNSVVVCTMPAPNSIPHVSGVSFLEEDIQAIPSLNVGVIKQAITLNHYELPALHKQLQIVFTPSQGKAQNKELRVFLDRQAINDNPTQHILKIHTNIDTAIAVFAIPNTATHVADIFPGSTVLLSPAGELTVVHPRPKPLVIDLSVKEKS